MSEVEIYIKSRRILPFVNPSSFNLLLPHVHVNQNLEHTVKKKVNY